MEIRHIIGGRPFEKEESYLELYMNKLLSKEEMELLNKYNITYEYLENNILKLTIIDYGDYVVQVIEDEESRMYAEKTEWYYEYLREVIHRKDKENTRSLVICDNGTKIELLVWEEKNEFRKFSY